MADAMACHPALARFPGEFWEFPPFRFQHLLNAYLNGIENTSHAPAFETGEFLPCIGRARIDYLTSNMDPHQRPLFKEPSVESLEETVSMFPQSKSHHHAS